MERDELEKKLALLDNRELDVYRVIEAHKKQYHGPPGSRAVADLLQLSRKKVNRIRRSIRQKLGPGSLD